MSEVLKVSVIIPTYNCEKYVGKCINSVLNQTLHNLELICVDDGSSDGTISLIRDYALRDDRVRMIIQENAGPGAARNAALAVARGQYVYCLDADDYMDCTMLKKCVKALDNTAADVAVVAFRTYNEQCGSSFPAEWSMRNEDVYPSYPRGAFSWKTAPDLFFETVQNVPWNKVIRRSLLEEHDIRFQRIRLSEDLMYSLPAAIAAKRIVRVAQPLMVHREFTNTNAMANKSLYPLDFLDAFDALRSWLQTQGLYGCLRLAYQTWLLDAIYYNLLTYHDFEGFDAAYEQLIKNELCAFDLAELSLSSVRDHRHRALLDALHQSSRERFLLACANIEAAEVQEQKCGFQKCQSSMRWLFSCVKEKLRNKLS